MTHFRAIHQCVTCGKIYRSDYFPMVHAGGKCMMVCGRCGGHHFELAIARPILFGLRGWEIGADHIKLIDKKVKPRVEVVKKEGRKRSVKRNKI